MSTKYHGLPDIDTAQDIFETADEPEGPLRPGDYGYEDDERVIKYASEDIDATGLPNRRKAEKVFGRGTRRRDLHPDSRHRRSTHTRSSSASSSSSTSAAKETPSARLRRLKAELAEVEAEIRSEPSASSSKLEVEENGDANTGKRKSVLPPRQPVDLLAELSSLRSRMDSLDTSDMPAGEFSNNWSGKLERLKQPAPTASAIEDPEDALPADRERKAGDASLSDLDKRLAGLEDMVGPSESSFDEGSTPLLITLKKLDHLLSLLTQPRHLDAISRRVKLLLVDLDRAAAASRRHPTSLNTNNTEKSSNVTLSQEEYNSLQSLFALLPRLDPLLPILPFLLNRLRSLAGLHSEAGNVVANLRKLEESENRSNEEVKDLLGTVEGVKKGLEDAGVAVGKNWDGLEGRLKDLEGRIKALNS